MPENHMSDPASIIPPAEGEQPAPAKPHGGPLPNSQTQTGVHRVAARTASATSDPGPDGDGHGESGPGNEPVDVQGLFTGRERKKPVAVRGNIHTRKVSHRGRQ